MVQINGQNLTLEKFVQIARYNEKVKISEISKQNVLKARTFVEEVIEQEIPTYGINTGFGKLSDQSIGKCDVAKLQKNLLMSHACGVGEPFSDEIVRGMMLLRINALIKGYSGIRLLVLEKMVEFLNKNIIPVVFSKGSLGASGDLAPLSHMCLPLIGLGEIFYKGKRYPSAIGLQKAKISPLTHLEAKEGLSLINGTQAMTSVGAFVVYDAIELEKTASISLSLTMEALQAIKDSFDPKVHIARGHLGQIKVAERVLSLLHESKGITKQGELRIQDAYSIRCAPQVHGASYDAFQYVKKIVEIEMNAVTDNPIVFHDEKQVISAGNFHGQPLAIAFDYLGIAISELANIAERRIERLVNSNLSNGLPPFLVTKPGINSGFMIVQYSAASLVSENKVLAHPASVDSIPSSANQEDHVSMGTIGARKAMSILDNVRKVISMEMFTACQAIDLRNPEWLGISTKKVYDRVRQGVPYIIDDEVMYPHIHYIDSLLQSKEWVDFINNEVIHSGK